MELHYITLRRIHSSVMLPAPLRDTPHRSILHENTRNTKCINNVYFRQQNISKIYITTNVYYIKLLYTQRCPASCAGSIGATICGALGFASQRASLSTSKSSTSTSSSRGPGIILRRTVSVSADCCKHSTCHRPMTLSRQLVPNIAIEFHHMRGGGDTIC